MILAGDVGGSKVRLGLFAAAPAVAERPRVLAEATFASADLPGLGAAVARFLASEPVESVRRAHGGGVETACFGVAGPVIGGRVATTNLPWTIEAAAVAAECALPAVRLINDLVATAHGLPALGPDRLERLDRPELPELVGPSEPSEQQGDPAGPPADRPEAARAGGNAVLLAPGTGLGMALLPRVGGTLVPVPSEGGHMDYPARTDEEIELLRHLRELYGRVSLERVASGLGMPAIYRFVRQRGLAAGAVEDPALGRELAAGDDPGAAIARAALERGDPLADRTLDLFVAALGAAAGNLALIGTATAGVYLGGGIPPKILPKLRQGGFLSAFRDKGRFRDYVAAIPVWVVLDPDTALLGAARVAAGHAAC